MREWSWTQMVRRASALALVWVLVAVASWLIASGVHNGRRQPHRLAAATPVSLQLPTLNATLPSLRAAHRRSTRPATHRDPHRSRSGGSSHKGGTTRGVAQTSGASQVASSPVSSSPTSGSESSGAESSGSGSSGSSSSRSNVPPTGGPPPP
jgi:hypothetical protein